MDHEENPTSHGLATHCRPKNHPETLPWPPNIPELLQSCYGINTYPSPPDADQNGTSQKAFNWKMAVAAFSEEYMQTLAMRNFEDADQDVSETTPTDDDAGPSQSGFRGDWFQYSYLLRCHETPAETRGLDNHGCLCPFCANNPWRGNPKTQKEGVTIHLENVILKGIRLENARLWGANLANAELMCANLNNANLMYAHLENASLRMANLENAQLGYAHLNNANLWIAHLENTSLRVVNLENAVLRYSNLENAELMYANLDNADVRLTTGLVFDHNRASRLLISGDAPDPWSVLRRTYTGPAFFFHLTLLILFLLPYAGKTLFFTWESKAVERIETLATNHVETIPDSISPVKDYFQQQLDRWNEIPKVSAIWPLLGYPSWWAMSLTFFLIIYNGLRFILTTRVSLLRDAEERSKITPTKEEYLGKTELRYTGMLQKNYWTGGWDAIKTWFGEIRTWLPHLCKSSRPKFWNTLGLYRVHLITIKMMWIGYGIIIWRVITWLWCVQIPMR